MELYGFCFSVLSFKASTVVNTQVVPDSFVLFSGLKKKENDPQRKALWKAICENMKRFCLIHKGHLDSSALNKWISINGLVCQGLHTTLKIYRLHTCS